MMVVENVFFDVRIFYLFFYMILLKEEEDYLMELMKSCNIFLDVIFYNIFIKKKVVEEGVEEVKVYV